MFDAAQRQLKEKEQCMKKLQHDLRTEIHLREELELDLQESNALLERKGWGCFWLLLSLLLSLHFVCVLLLLFLLLFGSFLCLFGGRGWGVGACMHILKHACAFSAHMRGHMLPHAHTLMHTPGPSLPIAVCLFFSPLSLFPPFSQSFSLWVSLLSLSLPLPYLPPPPPPPPVSPSFSLNVILSLWVSLGPLSLFKPRVVLTFSCCYDGFYHQTVPSGTCSSRYSAWGRCKTDWMNLAPCRTQNWSWNVMLRGQYGNGDRALSLFLSRQTCFVTTNVFVTTKQIFCHDKSMLAATKPLLWQNLISLPQQNIFLTKLVVTVFTLYV